jgi:DNA mismatch repair protein MutS2
MEGEVWSHAELALELPRVVERAAAECETEVGREEMLALRPSYFPDVISMRVRQAIEAMALLGRGTAPTYSNVRDVRESVSAASKGSLLAGEMLFRVAESLGAMARLRQWLVAEKDAAPSLWPIAENLAYLPQLKASLDSAVGPDGEVLDSASPALKSLRSQKHSQGRRMAEKLQSLISGQLKPYLQEALFTQRDGRFVVPVKAQFRAKVPGIVHDASGSGQTVFIEPEVIVGAMNKLREIDAAESEEVERILSELSETVGKFSEEILAGISSVAALDAIFAKARLALSWGGEEPVIANGHFIKIIDGHHPLLSRGTSVPLTVSVGGVHKSLLITGPNTGGKTVALKCIGLYAMMLGCGLLPPARKVEYAPFTGVWADIGDEQSLQQSLSTFSGHLRNIASMFVSAKSGALVLFDEIGAGTDPSEGAALGKAILSTLADRNVTVAASTHYGELKEFALNHPAFVSAAMEFDQKTLSPTYHLIPGAAGASHAFEIARRYGLPPTVVALAEELLGDEAKEERSKSEKLDEIIASAREERRVAEELANQLRLQERALEAERAELKAKLAKAREQADERIEAAIREARESYRVLLELAAEKKLGGKEREELLSEARTAEAELKKLHESVHQPEQKSDYGPAQLKVGMEVTVQGHPQVGKVLELQKSGNVIVLINNLKLTVKPSDLSPAKPRQEKSLRPRSSKLSLERAMGVSGELMLRHLSVEQALEQLERFFDDASLAGLHRARIVHGKGNGVLRRVVRDFLAKRRDVKSFEEASPSVGGSGVTEVEFRS